MRKLLLILSLLAGTASSQTSDFECENEGTPSERCYQLGYVCNIGFDVANAKDVLYFNLGADTTCSTLNTSKFQTYNIDNQPSPYAIFFLIEDEYNAGPLSLTLAGSIALSSAVNKAPVQILYTKVDTVQYGGLRLLSIRLQQTFPLQ